jgi:hypothetical protein
MAMLELVTVADARAQLRLDEVDSGGGADDAWLAISIPAVSDAVARWLKDSWRLYVLETDADGNIIEDSSGQPTPIEDSAGALTVKPVVRLAVLVELASQFRFREGEGSNSVPTDAGYGHTLSAGATSLLSALRRSTVA